MVYFYKILKVNSFIYNNNNNIFTRYSSQGVEFNEATL